MGDSGIFGDAKTMRTVPNSLYKAPKQKTNKTADMLTGKYKSKGMQTRLNNIISKTFFK